MQRTMLKSKLHRVTATHADLHYEGSCAIDEDLLDAANIREYEEICIWNVNNGERFITYAIKGERGSGIISVNGSAARRAAPGDMLIIATFALYAEAELTNHQPVLIYVDADNHITHTNNTIPTQARVLATLPTKAQHTLPTEQVKQYFQHLQANIIASLEKLDGKTFHQDSWQREEGGGGNTCVLENGQLFARAGVNFSHVFGHNLPPSASQNRPELAGRSFEAMGVSLVLHPHNPYVPTVHMNVRFFIATKAGEQPVWWFGGGMDLTPYYGFTEDAQHFHQTCHDALHPFDPSLYPQYKAWCDRYFFIQHRNEPRGIGGIVFDDVNHLGFAQSFAMIQSVGDHFLAAYTPIVEKRRAMPYGERETAFQAYRRTRYVEFNLLHDRGTLFGLQSGGRTESILVSMPPQANWRYNWQPEPGSPEEKLYTEFLVAKDWI